MENKPNFETIVIVVMLIVLAAVAGWGITRHTLRREAIAQGAAHYTLHGSEALFAWGPAPK